MALEMFGLRPGGRLRYAVRGASVALVLDVARPDEGASAELELVLRPGAGLDDPQALPGLADPRAEESSTASTPLGRGRVPLDGGYLAVLRELGRQLAEAELEANDPELVRVEEPGAHDRERSAGAESDASADSGPAC